MRNVQQWQDPISGQTFRVFQSTGTTKTLQEFLEDKYKVTHKRGISGQIIHISGQQYRVYKDDYVICDTTTFEIFLRHADKVSDFMAMRNCRFIGLERRNSKMLISEDVSEKRKRQAAAQRIQVVAGNWKPSQKAEVKEPKPLLSDINDIQASARSRRDGQLAQIQTAKTVFSEQPTEETEETEVAYNSGLPVPESKKPADDSFREFVENANTQAEEKKPAKKKNPFFERLLGFLPIFRR